MLEVREIPSYRMTTVVGDTSYYCSLHTFVLSSIQLTVRHPSPHVILRRIEKKLGVIGFLFLLISEL